MDYSSDDEDSRVLLFARPRSQIFLPAPAPVRRPSYYGAVAVPSGRQQRRSVALLDRSKAPVIHWEEYRKSVKEIKAIKSKKMRRFYEKQVFSRL
jgi:hypothetical protein